MRVYLLAFLLLASVVLSSIAANADLAVPCDARTQFQQPQALPLNRDDVLAGADRGLLVLTFGTCVYPIQITQDSTPAQYWDNGTSVLPAPDAADFRWIQGAILGNDMGRVFISVSPLGVDGTIHDGNTTVAFEFGDPYANTTVDYVRVTSWPSNALAAPGGFSILSTTQTVRFDTDYALGGTSAGRTHAVNVIGKALSELNPQLNFNFNNWGIYHCTTSSCDSTTLGISTVVKAEDMRDNYGTKMKARGESWDNAALLTGKNMDGAYGIAFNAGRYTVSQIRDEGDTYDARSSTHEGALTLAHELMHNYRAGHETSEYRYEEYSRTVCYDQPSLILICLDEREEVYRTERYFHLMYESSWHQPTPPSGSIHAAYQDFQIVAAFKSHVNNCQQYYYGGVTYNAQHQSCGF